MKPSLTNNTYTITETQLLKALDIDSDEKIEEVVVHQNPDGTKISIRTYKGRVDVGQKHQIKTGY